jgi:hypothetical protein
MQRGALNAKLELLLLRFTPAIAASPLPSAVLFAKPRVAAPAVVLPSLAQAKAFAMLMESAHVLPDSQARAAASLAVKETTGWYAAAGGNVTHKAATVKRAGVAMHATKPCAHSFAPMASALRPITANVGLVSQANSATSLSAVLMQNTSAGSINGITGTATCPATCHPAETLTAKCPI